MRRRDLSLLGFRALVDARTQRLVRKLNQGDESRTVDFAGIELTVDPGVFDPSVGEGSQLFTTLTDRLHGRFVLDIGTGTGALALLAAQHGARVVATDVSEQALACARTNAVRLGLDEQITFRTGFGLDPVASDELFDLVMFNPPFLEGRPGTLAERALFDPGYGVLVSVISRLPEVLATDGRLLLAFGEVGDTSYLHWMARNAGLALTPVASCEVDSLEFVVYEGRVSR